MTSLMENNITDRHDQKQTTYLVSVIITTRNRSEFVKKAIESALEVQSQKFDIEIIVVDDGSTDNTPEVLQQYSVVYIRTNGIGMANARNTGLRAAHGNFVTLLDDDDGQLRHSWSREFDGHEDHLRIRFGEVVRHTFRNDDEVPLGHSLRNSAFDGRADRLAISSGIDQFAASRQRALAIDNRKNLGLRRVQVAARRIHSQRPARVSHGLPGRQRHRVVEQLRDRSVVDRPGSDELRRVALVEEGSFALDASERFDRNTAVAAKRIRLVLPVEIAERASVTIEVVFRPLVIRERSLGR